jgi:hypothetical protein
MRAEDARKQALLNKRCLDEQSRRRERERERAAEQELNNWRAAAMEIDVPRAIACVKKAVECGHFNVRVSCQHASRRETETKAGTVRSTLKEMGYFLDPLYVDNLGRTDFVGPYQSRFEVRWGQAR